MKVHYLKTWPEYLERVMNGQKPFEVRKNDRDFQVGDQLILQGYHPETKEYNGSDCVVDVTYVLHGPAFGIESGYVVMGIKHENNF